MKIGIFSTFIEPAALELVKTIQDAVDTQEIPNTEICFIFSNREIGDNPTTDNILHALDLKTVPLVSFSAARFKPDMRKKARQEENVSLINQWRNQFGEEVLKRLPQTDMDLLLGDMYIWGDNLCAERNGINLHPALPNGPKGEWYKVIWQLIQEGAKENGVMMHKVTRGLDRGATAAFSKFPIIGEGFDHLWNKFPKDRQNLKSIIKNEKKKKEKTNYPLHKQIRKAGFLRETPLIIQTLKAFSTNKISFHGDSLIDHNKNVIVGGYDLTRTVEEYIFDKSSH